MLQQFGKNYPNTLPNLFNVNWQKSNTLYKERKGNKHTKLRPQHYVPVLRNIY